MGSQELDPLRQELLGVQKRMNDLFESALARTNFETSSGFDSWSPVCDVYEDGSSLVLCLELPGVEQEQLDIHIDGDELVVQGHREMDRESSEEHYHRVERSYGRFSRRFPLSPSVARDGIDASYADGLLRIVLPRRDSENHGPQRIEVRR